MTCRIFSFHATARLVVALLLFLANAPTGSSQDKPKETSLEAKTLEKRCNPVIVKKPTLKGKAIQVREGEESTGFTPLIVFQILESGEVAGARVKRSSGIKDMDDLAMNSIKSTKYNARPGCPAIGSKADVIIDFR